MLKSVMGVLWEIRLSITRLRDFIYDLLMKWVEY